MGLHRKQRRPVRRLPQPHLAIRRSCPEIRSVRTDCYTAREVKCVGDQRFHQVRANEAGVLTFNLLQIDLAQIQARQIEALQMAALQTQQIHECARLPALLVGRTCA